MSKRILLILLPAVVAFAVIYAVYLGLKPRLQKWLVGQINRIAADKLPVRIQVQNVDWRLLFPEIELEGIEINSKTRDLIMPPVKIEKAAASLDLFSIFGGRIAISTLILEKPQVSIGLDPYLQRSSKNPDEDLPLREFFQLLRQIPVARFGLSKTDVSLQSDKYKFTVRLRAADLLAINGKDRIHLQMDLNDSSLDFNKVGEVPFRVQGEAMVNAQTLDVSNLKISFLNTLISAKGSLTDLPRIHKKAQGTLEFEVNSDLDRLISYGQSLIHLPITRGRVNASGRIDMNPAQEFSAGFKFTALGLKVDQFAIGDLQFQGSFENKKLQIPQIALTNEAGLVDVKDLEIDFSDDQFRTKAGVSTEQIDLHELLKLLGVGDIPLELFIGTNLDCAGPLKPQLEFRCQGKVIGEQMEVRTGEKYNDTLVLIDEFGAQGEFSVSPRDVRFSAQLQIDQDSGETDGVVSYQHGFKINYSSPSFQLKNLRRLAGLKFEGSTSVRGSTQGHSGGATFSMDLKTRDFAFEDFVTGSPSGRLSYQSGILALTNLEGELPNSKYSANLNVDLRKKRISAAGQLPRLDLTDLFSVFQRMFQLPVEFTGGGKASFQVEGPFSLGQLSYDLDAQINQGILAGESFDQIQLKLKSQSGEMEIQNARLFKGKNSLLVTGQGRPNGQVDLLIRGQGLPIEESENISKIGSQISGLMDIQTALKGFILDPDVAVQGRVYQLIIEEQDFAQSDFSFDISKEQMRGDTNLFGGQLKARFQIPFTETNPFDLNLTADNWNYTTLFALIGGGALLNEYKASLTGTLELVSNKGGLWTSSGKGTIQSLLLQRGSLSLQNRNPMELTMSEGMASLNNFRVEGDRTFFEIRGRQVTKDNLNLRLDGQAHLRLFQIFVPFLEELGGTANIAADFSGPILKPEVLGTANVRGGFAKLKGFPHAFERTTADVQFSQSKILISQLDGSLAGGTFEGDGSVIIEGPRNLPTSIKARLTRVNLNVPDRVRTNGNAEMTFSGNWFPFTLSGTYYVQGGFMDKELTEDSGVNNLKQSSYLPKMILQSAFEPVILDLQILLERPLSIKNSLVEGTVTGNILVRGAPTMPALGGQVVTEKGTKAIFRDKVFDVQNATVRFTGDADINPDLYVSARSRIDEYDINMLIQGNAKNPAIKLSSVPPLNDQDIISLIALGVKSNILERQVQEGNKAKEDTLQGAALGVFTQSGPIKKLQNTTGLQLQISTSYDDTRNVSVQRVTLSKQINEKVRASATQSRASVSSSREFNLQYSLTPNLSAIGRYEDREYNENTGLVDQNRESQSILGIDLEFKREFK